MARNIPESKEMTVFAFLRQGEPKSKKVTFVFLKDGAEIDRVDGELSDADVRTAKAAVCKYTPPAVPNDKPKYLLEYYVIADGDEYRNSDEIHVWPHKVKVETRTEDGSKALPNLKFKPGIAAPVTTGQTEAAAIKTTGDPARAEFVLRMGKEFDPTQIQAVPPWEFVGEPEKLGGSIRNLKYKAKLNLVGEVIAPVIPDDKKIKQWVNLATADDGRDGNGDAVKFKVGIKDDATRDPAEKVGKAGVFLFIQVEFGADGTLQKSDRNSPKPTLKQTGDVSGWTEVTVGVKYKAKVELKGPNGTGEFEVVVGRAGGDTCTVKVGGTDACGDAEVTFTNWRKIYYELMMPDFLADTEDSPLDGGGGTAKGILAAGRTNMKTSGDKTYIEYGHVRTHRFSEGEAPAGTVMPREFFGRATGNAKVYLLTDHTFTRYPTGHAFAKAAAGITCCVKACDVNLFYDGPGVEAYVPAEESSETAAVPIPLTDYWLPKSGYDGGEGVKTLRWVTDTTGLTLPVRPKLTVTDNTVPLDTGKDRTIKLTETTLGVTADVVFLNPWIGDVPTALTDVNHAAVQAFVDQVCTQANLKTVRNALAVQVSGPVGEQRRLDRIANVKSALRTKVAAKFGYHPGLTNGQTARSGPLAFTDIDVAASTWVRMVVNLPAVAADDPGSFVGPPATEQKCKVKVRVEYEPHHGGLGLAGQGLQKGELLVVWGQNSPLCMTDTVLHELGHQYLMTPYQMSAGAHSPGLRRPKSITQTEDVAEYKTNGTKGNYYDEHEHSGNHCAFGLSDAQKGLADYLSGDTWKAAQCLMYGSNTDADGDRCPREFCPQCVAYIRARDLSALA